MQQIADEVKRAKMQEALIAIETEIHVEQSTSDNEEEGEIRE